MDYLICLIFGLTPGIIWLLFYLRKDEHPESNKMVLKIFFLGMLIALPTALIEMGVANLLLAGEKIDIMDNEWSKNFPLLFLAYNFLAIALVEELLKYLVVREKVLNNPEFDEPVDIMLYMIIAALGFATLENILIFLPGEGAFRFSEALLTSVFRFWGATLLHALSSGLIGYFMALAFFNAKRRLTLIFLGLGIAAVLHGAYNISIIKIGESPGFIILTVILLAALAFFVSAGFRKVKKMASICKSK